MGNYRFKLSNMMPNAWFYKLKEMGRARKQTQTTQSKKKKNHSSQQASTTSHSSSKSKQPHQCNPRKSYYFTRELNHNHNRIYTSPPKNQTFSHPIFPPETPRKSFKQKPKRRIQKTCSSSPKNTTSPVETESPDPEVRTDRILHTESFDVTVSASTNDIIIDIDNNSIVRKDDKLDKLKGCDSFSKLMLPPIVTKPEKFNDLLNDVKKRESKPRNRISSHEEKNMKGSLKVKIVKDDSDSASMKEQRNSPVRRYSVSSHQGVRLRMNSPRISSRKIRRSVSSTTASRRSLSDSFAIVKSSFNPQRDFRESMVEMIVQNNIRTSKDLEDLLACYLCLNSDEYHDLIIEVFKQIWFELTDIH